MKREEKTVHEVLLKMLDWFHGICKEHHLRYYCVGGTMLGAVRHKGFIPWDDDIDVAMPRADYEKLCACAAELETSQYKIEYPTSENKDFTYLYMKIYDASTLLVEHQRKPIKRGVFIDVFPLDGIGEDRASAMGNYIKILRAIRFHATITCAVRQGRTWYKNLSVRLGRLVSPLLVSERALNQRITMMCKCRGFDTCAWVGNLVGNWGCKELMPREYFGEPQEYEFEHIRVWGVAKAHEYLSSLYGNYMQLPPEEKRKTHHDYIACDLNSSYLDK